MRLVRCHIENFGKLQNVDVDFSENPALFCQENGWGKSTLAAFLVVMFYGFAGEAKRKNIENERKRYMPWQGGPYGGSLVFETGGTCYEVTRIFGGKQASDVFELRDGDTNLRTDAYSSELGEELFGINRESFEQTIYISQKDRHVTATDGIHARLGVASDEEQDMDSYEAARNALTAVINSLNPKRKSGSLYKLQEENARMKQQVAEQAGLEQSLEQVEHLKDQDKETLKGYEEAQAEINRQQELLSARQDQQVQQGLYRQLREQVADCQAAMLPGDEQYQKDPVEEAEVSDLISRWGRRMQSRSEMEQMAARLKSMEQDYEDMINAGAGKVPPFVPVGVLMIVIGALLTIFVSRAFGIMWIAVGVVLILAKKKYMAMHKPPVSPQEDPDYQELEQRLKETRDFSHGVDDDVRAFLKRYGRDYHMNSVAGDLQQIWTGYVEYQSRKKNLEQAQARLQAFREDNQDMVSAGVWSADQQESMVALQQEKQQIEQDMQILQKRIQLYEVQTNELRQQMDDREVVKQELELSEQKLAEGLRQHMLLEKTRDLLEEAHEQMVSQYTGPLLAGFEKYYGMVTGMDPEGFRVDANLDISKTEQGMQRDLNWLSEGNQDLISLCMRLAMVDAMYIGEKPFLVLDDPFVNLDQDKCRGGLELLQKLAGEYQVIYFTCTPDRLPE